MMNRFLVRVFNEVLKTEENCLADSSFPDLSLRELHVIEAVALGGQEGRNSAAEVAQSLGITAGTLTTTVGLLVKKGYLTREKDVKDKRIVRIYVTEKGKKADRAHQGFHQDMVCSILNNLSPEEARVFVQGLENISRFFKEKFEKGVNKI